MGQKSAGCLNHDPNLPYDEVGLGHYATASYGLYIIIILTYLCKLVLTHMSFKPFSCLQATMPRIYTKKTARSRKTKEEIKFAVTRVIQDGLKIRRVADDLGFSFSALQRHVQRAKCLPEGQQINYVYEANPASRKVFTEEQESRLCEYLKMCSKMHYGLGTKETKQFAYEFAKHLRITYPREWDEHKSAGRDWLLGFMDRNTSLSLRQPEATSLGRSSGFNKFNVGSFFENLVYILEKHRFSAEKIFNLDETGCTTVHKPPRVIAAKGQKQVGQVTSGERGKLITVCCFINAAGNTLPPAIIFPLKKFKDHMTINAPENTLGLANASGWMTKENFVAVIKHFIKYSGATKENPCLLLLDNHESHVNIDVVALAKANGIHLLTFPPHCSHRLQPLDVSVYGPFKAYYNAAASTWMTSNPGKTLTIYHLPELIKVAFNKAMSRQNIISGFEKTGIHPLNPDMFTESDFLMSSVTDRENPPLENQTLSDAEAETVSQESLSEVDELLQLKTEVGAKKQTEFEVDATKQPEIESAAPQASVGPINIPRPNEINILEHEPKIMSSPESITTVIEPKINIISNIIITPEMVRPFPKAEARKLTNRKGRKKGKTRILTETPEKEELERIENEKLLKGKQNVKRKVNLHNDNVDIKKPKRAEQQEQVKSKASCKKRKKFLDESETEDSDEASIAGSDESDYDPNNELETDFDHSVAALAREDYIVVRFSAESNRKVSPDIHYVGQVEEIHSNQTCKVNFMRKRGTSATFFFPENEDKVGDIDFKNIVMRLPPPISVGGTSRAVQYKAFQVDLSCIKNLR